MTDKETLLSYRLRQAEETLADAEKMLESGFSPRSIVNRAYYAMFYDVLALFINFDLNPKTSKHSGVIAIFDKEFIHTARLDKRYSKMLHKLFESRQKGDYKELAEISPSDASTAVEQAKEFHQAIRSLIEETGK